MILANHNNKLSITSQLFLRVEAPKWLTQVSKEVCKEILGQSYKNSNTNDTVFDLFKACIQEEHGASDTHITYYINQTNATVINITTPTNKQHTVLKALKTGTPSRTAASS